LHRWRYSLRLREFSPTDHVGMVGLFPSLAKRLRAQGVALTVLEIDVLGDTAVLDADELAARLANGEPWGEAVRRYAIDATTYPGLDTLLA